MVHLKKNFKDKQMNAIAVMTLSSIALVAFYITMVPAYWFFRRYFVAFEAVIGIGLAIIVSQKKTPVRVMFLSALVLVSSTQWLTWLWTPSNPIDFGYHGAKGYLAPASQILSMVPNGASLGSLQTGALSYLSGCYSERKIRVYNLDGVVNQKARMAISTRRLSDYTYAQGIHWFADWEFNYKVFMKGSSSSPVKASFTPIGLASPQGRDCFILSKVGYTSTSSRD